MEVTLKQESIYGWNGYRYKAGDITLGVTPDIGGRINSLTFKGQELFFVPEYIKGQTFDFAFVDDIRAEKDKVGFQVYGGDKTWVAPEREWWDWIPPLDLDCGKYKTSFDDKKIIMTSLKCKETGLQIIREVSVDELGKVTLNQTFLNKTDQPITKGIWDVTQINRPLEVYLPALPENIRSYHTEEKSYPENEFELEEEEGWVRINCFDANLFKFGGMLNQGAVLSVKHHGVEEAICFLREFAVFENATYAHRSMVEVYNDLKQDYCEVEVHSPLVTIEPGSSYSHSQRWTFGQLKGALSPKEMFEALTK